MCKQPPLRITYDAVQLSSVIARILFIHSQLQKTDYKQKVNETVFHYGVQ